MTAHKHLKQRVRARMDKTGESYSTARRRLLEKLASPDSGWHLPGCVPATTALRILLTHAGVRAPHTGQPFTEAMLFGIAGGIGIGVFSFFYEKEGFASLYLAGRHLFHDFEQYLTAACERFGLKPVVQESSGGKSAEKQLRTALAEYGPCIAWVDAALLPHRGMPAHFAGSAYHVVTVYSIDDAGGTALIGDLTDEPVSIPLEALTAARGRIKKDKHRLLSLPKAQPGQLDLGALVGAGLKACHHGLSGGAGFKNARTNFSLDSVALLAERLHGSKDHERWERVFAPGPRFWRGLTSVCEYVEYHGTGGGLCRPLFAESLTEAADALDAANLRELAGRYDALGKKWSELADAALPRSVPLLRATREALTRRSEAMHSGGSLEEICDAWAELGQLERQAGAAFPLTESECADLRADLQKRVRALHAGEVAALDALAACCQ